MPGPKARNQQTPKRSAKKSAQAKPRRTSAAADYERRKKQSQQIIDTLRDVREEMVEE